MKAIIKWAYKDKKGIYHDPWDYEDEGDVLYTWEEGNWSCDCNRSIFFLKRKLGKEMKCGDKIKVTGISFK